MHRFWKTLVSPIVLVGAPAIAATGFFLGPFSLLRNLLFVGQIGLGVFLIFLLLVAIESPRGAKRAACAEITWRWFLRPLLAILIGVGATYTLESALVSRDQQFVEALVPELEAYRAANGEYPENLEQLGRGPELAKIADYQRVRDGFRFQIPDRRAHSRLWAYHSRLGWQLELSARDK